MVWKCSWDMRSEAVFSGEKPKGIEIVCQDYLSAA